MSSNDAPSQPPGQEESPAYSEVTAAIQMDPASATHDENASVSATDAVPQPKEEDIKDIDMSESTSEVVSENMQAVSATTPIDTSNNTNQAEERVPEPQPSESEIPSSTAEDLESTPAIAVEVKDEQDSETLKTASVEDMETEAQEPSADAPKSSHTPTPDTSAYLSGANEQASSPQPPAIAKVMAPPQESSSSQGGGAYRPLNVRDALTYLDQVKVQFSDQPDVYNKFLDIMKDFKSQAIDTPGVIERVSALFRGHPSLISGFNTFLPPGYRIECSLDNNQRDIIKVTTPTGTTTTTGGGVLQLSREGQQPAGPSSYYGGSYEPASTSQEAVSHPGMGQYQEGTPTHSTPDGDQEQLSPDSRRAPVEFNHAINYVNKIKNRFGNEPDTYKQFLEILQTYQKEQKPIQEVYALVQVLFKDATDLLSEFKQFLPEVTGQPASSFFFEDSFQGRPGKKVGLGNRKKRATGENGSDIAKGIKRSKMHHKTDYSEVSSARDEAFEILEPKQPSMSAEEAEFFDRVKKHINNKATYNEFLKVLNLFSQQVLDQNTLVERIENFIGNDKKLFKWFKEFVGYDGKDEIVENIPATTSRPEFIQSKSFGQSYRLIPKSLPTEMCSGRDALCQEVLNDHYVSHPTWSSEDSGFVSSKKNQYEEALHRCEEERYDYDLNIEANLNTIALLDPIAKKISIMSNEDKMNFKLPPGLGGPSKTIYQRIIKKVYGRERGLEIIDLLHENPAQVVPIVLKRLRQKDEEWKRAQREWNKIWREVDAKNYYKALDYLGINFKSTDRKQITSRALITEAETLKREQAEQRLRSKSIPTVKPSGLSQHQFRYTFADKALFSDVTRLIFSYLERQSGISNNDCNKIREFATKFVAEFFDMEDVSPDLNKKQVVEEVDDTMADDKDSQSAMSDDSEASNSGRSTSRRRQNNRGKSASKNLLKDATRRRRNAGRTQSPEADEKEATADESDVKAEEDEVPNDVNMEEATATSNEQNGDLQAQAPLHTSNVLKEINTEEQASTVAAAATAPIVEQTKISTIFGNNPFYCFLRLYQLVYHRLGVMKKIDAEFTANPERAKKENRAAVELGVSSMKFESIDLNFSQGYYDTLLDLIDKFFEGELDQQSFEECSRYIFGTKAYLMFTIDKVVHVLAKQMHTLIADEISSTLISVDRIIDSTSTKSLYQYSKQAEELVGSEENLYQSEFDANKRSLSIQLLGKEDINNDSNAEDRYESYVASYMDWTKDTDSVDHKKLRSSFLQRNLRPNKKMEHLDKAFVQSGMQYKICRNTYHMFYIIGSEDVFVRPHNASPDSSTLQESKKLRDWLESPMGWARDLSDEAKASKQAEAEALFEDKQNDEVAA